MGLDGGAFDRCSFAVGVSPDEVKAKIHGMVLALMDSPPGFDPALFVASYGTHDDMSIAEDAQL